MQFKLTFIAMALAASTSALPTIEDRSPHHGRGGHRGGRGGGAPGMFNSVTMKSTCGKCLAAQADPGAAGGNPVQLQACDASSAGQKWSMVSSDGNQDALIVNSLTNECISFDPAVQNQQQQITLVPCGQQGSQGGGNSTVNRRSARTRGFPLKGKQMTIEPVEGQGKCLTAKDEKTIEAKDCDDSDKNQLFTME